jgi:hypothetical protein
MGSRRNPAPYGHEEILRPSRGTLHTPDGPIKMHQIGKGAFSLAMVEDGVAAGVLPRVFVFSADDVYDKELLAMAHEADPANPHLPKVERFGYTQDKAVFVMPLYKAPLRKADSPEGWRDYAMLKKCRDKVYGMRKSGYEVNEDVYACAEAAGVRPSVLDALRALIDTAANYGAEYVFEFSPRNLATDEAGNLVLLDVLYDRERLTQLRRAAATRRGGGW